MDIGNRAIEQEQALQQELTKRKLDSNRARLQQQGSRECVACGEPITAARQAALPSARMCIGCQSAAERRAK